MIVVIYERGLIQPNPRNPIMSEKPLMSSITPRAMPSFNSFLQHVANMSRGAVTPSDYQCPYTAEMFRRPSAPQRAQSLMNERPLYSYSKSGTTQERRRE